LKVRTIDERPGNGLGADGLRALHAVQEVLLHRHGDELLDLGRGQAEALDLDLDDRRRELGEHVDRRLVRLGGSDCNQNCAREHHEESQSHAGGDD
jgi:hypothetical protein